MKVSVNSVKGYLEQMVEFHKMHYGTHDRSFLCIEDLILREGKPFEGSSPIERWGKRGEWKQCFQNAYLLVQQHADDLIYCEGFAHGAIVPVLHAWAVTLDGEVVETTWDHGEQYYGIPFDFRWVSEHIVRQGYWGVLGGHWNSLRDFIVEGLPEAAITEH